jgi:outer membrane receptor for ferrienterochelin and colicins
MTKILYFLMFVFFLNMKSNAQQVLSGQVKEGVLPVVSANIQLVEIKLVTQTDSLGAFKFLNVPNGTYTINVTAVGFINSTEKVQVNGTANSILFQLKPIDERLNEVVVTGTQKQVNRMDSPVPVEIYSQAYFRKNPTPSIFDALQNVNGVRPQLNCNICNTGDIHINGLEGPYTMVLIDGMPIVSSLSTVYGLSGIPNSLVSQIEVVKGPASSLYGSEAVGGLINIITKKVADAPLFSVDLMATGYQEYNADLGFKINFNKKVSSLTGINYFKFGNIVDHNHDGFTDLTLQDRISIFQKWAIERKENRVFSMAARLLYEDRWGGETRWRKSDRGGDQVYGESIYTKRFEVIGNYQLPVKEKLFLSFSATKHNQDSRYGTTSYIAQQEIAFAQLTWDKKIKIHDLLFGAALRYTYYDDNTPATAGTVFSQGYNKPERVFLPGIFFQDELTLSKKHSVLAGLRYDYNNLHGNIFTPRLAYKYAIDKNNIFRLNAGTGFRVVNIFTEDHAALTGAREVIIADKLRPERTYNVNVNYLTKLYAKNGAFFGIDATAFYTYFNNRIIGDFDRNPNQIIYDNLRGFAVSKGFTLNLDFAFVNGLKATTGITYQDVNFTTDGIKKQQILTERFSGNWAISYRIKKLNLGIDYTGNIYSPMRLPLIGNLDPRNPYSPTWSIQNIQFVFDGFKQVELYGGIKNLLNFTPSRGTPFLVARANDPFDKNVKLDSNGQVLATADNPYALTFDPNYVYAPNQGIRGFLGVRLFW